MRAALEHAVVGDPDAGLRLVAALTLFWLFTGRYQESDAAQARALEAAGDEPTPLRSRVLALHWFCLGWEAMVRGRTAEARELLARSTTRSPTFAEPVASASAPPDSQSGCRVLFRGRINHSLHPECGLTGRAARRRGLASLGCAAHRH